MTILLRQPSVAELLDDADLGRLEGEPEWQLLVEIARHCRGRQISTPLLLSEYQESPYFDYLRSLAEKDPMLSHDQLAEEFLATLKGLLDARDNLKNQKLMDELKRKNPSELTPEEKAFLVRFRRPPG